MIFRLFAKNPQKEARQLARDVASIIDAAEHTYRPELLDEIAVMTRDGIKALAESCGDDSACRMRELGRYKSLHREARRQNSQVKLTAYTLLIIDTRAEALAELGAPARLLIEQFLDRWPAQDGTEGTLLG